MFSSAAHYVDQPRQVDPCASFVADAQENLAIVREVFGPQSRRYVGLAERYLATAERLECRASILRVLVSLATPPAP